MAARLGLPADAGLLSPGRRKSEIRCGPSLYGSSKVWLGAPSPLRPYRDPRVRRSAFRSAGVPLRRSVRLKRSVASRMQARPEARRGFESAGAADGKPSSARRGSRLRCRGERLPEAGERLPAAEERFPARGQGFLRVGRRALSRARGPRAQVGGQHQAEGRRR